MKAIIQVNKSVIMKWFLLQWNVLLIRSQILIEHFQVHLFVLRIHFFLFQFIQLKLKNVFKSNLFSHLLRLYLNLILALTNMDFHIVAQKWLIWNQFALWFIIQSFPGNQ